MVPVIALVGRPNVGKSTLFNRLTRSRDAIVGDLSGLTRDRQYGEAKWQGRTYIVIDTGGISGDEEGIDAKMAEQSLQAIEEADAVLFLVDARAGMTASDQMIGEHLRRRNKQSFLVVNKVDKLADKTALLPFIAQITHEREFASVHPVSAMKSKGLDALVKDLIFLMPESEPHFGEDEITDRSERFLAGELVREQLMLRLGEELPYSTTVEIEKFEEDGELLRIAAVIWVEREGQKPIVIGKGGERMKAISTGARIGMEKLFGRKVFLETWCRVREGWSDDEAALRRFGYSY